MRANNWLGRTTMKRLRNITRIDHEASRTYAWRVTLQRRNVITVKPFSDATHGGKLKALKAALKYRDQLLPQYQPFDHHVWVRTRLRKNNTSGIPGVARYDKIANFHTGRREVFWLAHWVDEYGASRKRKFSVLLYGERQAKRLAVAERERQLIHAVDLGSGVSIDLFAATRMFAPPGEDKDPTGRLLSGQTPRASEFH